MKLPGLKSNARSMQARLAAADVVALIALRSHFAPLPRAFSATFVPISGAGSNWSFNAINNWITNVASSGMKVNYQRVAPSRPPKPRNRHWI